MTTAVRINNIDKYVVFTNINEFIENLKDAQFYFSHTRGRRSAPPILNSFQMYFKFNS